MGRNYKGELHPENVLQHSRAYIVALQTALVAANLSIGSSETHPDGIDGIRGEHTRAAEKQLAASDPQKYQEMLAKAAIIAAQSKSTMSKNEFNEFADMRQGIHATATGQQVQPVHATATQQPAAKQVETKPVARTTAPAVKTATTPSNAHTEKTAVFDFKTGKIYLPNGHSVDAGSGKGIAKNNPAQTDQKLHGAIPEGAWRVELPADNTYKMADGSTRTNLSLRLTPDAHTDTKGRGGFLIHPPHSPDLQTIGCIAVSEKALNELAAARKNGLFTNLVVTRDAQTYTPSLLANGTKPRSNTASMSFPTFN